MPHVSQVSRFAFEYSNLIYDGMDYESVQIVFPCPACRQSQSVGLLDYLSKANRWEAAHPPRSLEAIYADLGLRLHQWETIITVQNLGGQRSFPAVVDCKACSTSIMLAVAFFEFQPMRYMVHLDAVAIWQP